MSERSSYENTLETVLVNQRVLASGSPLCVLRNFEFFFPLSKVDVPTNIASMHLVMGCPNARAGVEKVKKKTLRAT